MLQQTTLNPKRHWSRRILEPLLRAPRRALILPASAAALGLIVAGVSLLHKIPSPVSTVPPGYIALVNQKGILLSDFMFQTSDETGKDFEQTTQAERNGVLRAMIDEELLVQRGLTLDLPETTTEVRSVIAAAVDTQVAQPVLARAVSDDELRKFYELHKSDFTDSGSMTLRDLVLHVGGYQNIDQSTAQAETDAAEAAYQLRAGAGVDYVMQHFGFVDSGRADNGEQFDFAVKLHLGDKLFAVARTLTDGAVSDPVQDTDGVHLLIMERRLPERTAEFDAVRAKVYTALRDAQRKQAGEENLRLLRREAQIILGPQPGPPSGLRP